MPSSWDGQVGVASWGRTSTQHQEVEMLIPADARSMSALHMLTRALAEAAPEGKDFAVAELLEYIAREFRDGNAKAAKLQFALAPTAAWARIELRWADGWFNVIEVGPRGHHA
jgi:hypothetical protein